MPMSTRPFQERIPFWYPGSPVTAGRHGMSLMWPGKISPDAYELYLKTWDEHRGDEIRFDGPDSEPRVGYSMLLSIATTEAEARDREASDRIAELEAALALSEQQRVSSSVVVGAVRERLERGQRECADLISQMVRQDAGLDDEEAHLLSVGMVGLAQVTARYWLSTRGRIPREAAEQLVARLAWRGISGWPRS